MEGCWPERSLTGTVGLVFLDAAVTLPVDSRMSDESPVLKPQLIEHLGILPLLSEVAASEIANRSKVDYGGRFYRKLKTTTRAGLAPRPNLCFLIDGVECLFESSSRVRVGLPMQRQRRRLGSRQLMNRRSLPQERHAPEEKSGKRSIVRD